MMENKDYRLELKVKNNKLYSAIMNAGYANINDFSNKTGNASSAVGDLVNMKALPVNSNGEIRSIVQRIMDVLYVDFEDLFNIEQVQNKLEKNVFIKEVSQNDFIQLENEHIIGLIDEQQEETKKLEEIQEPIREALGRINPRYADIVRRVYGIDCEQKTTKELADEQGCCRGNISMLFNKGLSRLQNPKITRKLKKQIDL